MIPESTVLEEFSFWTLKYIQEDIWALSDPIFTFFTFRIFFKPNQTNAEVLRCLLITSPREGSLKCLLFTAKL